jgi:hypothetical protein
MSSLLSSGACNRGHVVCPEQAWFGAALASRRRPPADEVDDQQPDDCQEVELPGEHLDHRNGVADRSFGGGVAEAGGREQGEAEVVSDRTIGDRSTSLYSAALDRHLAAPSGHDRHQ